MSAATTPEPSAAAAPARPRRRRWPRVLLVVALVLVLLVVAAPWIMTALAPSLLDAAEDRFVATDLRAAKVKIGWLSGVTASGLTVAEPAGFPAGDALSVGGVRGRPAMADVDELPTVPQLRLRPASGGLLHDSRLKSAC